MSDLPEQFPDDNLPRVGSSRSDPSTNIPRPSRGQIPGGSRLGSTYRDPIGDISDDDDNYRASPPRTPAVTSNIPQLFAQASRARVPSTSRIERTPIETLQEYQISKSIATPIFPIIDIDRAFTASVLQGYIARGSSITGVDVNLLNVTVTALPRNDETVTVHWLCGHGMPLFDAIVWISADKIVRPQLRLKPDHQHFKILPPGVVAKSLFFCYFYLLTQAHYPSVSDQEHPVPGFLKNVAGLTESPATYMRNLCSFSPVLFDARWIQEVKFDAFGQEVMSRFGLGVAGYRMFAPFKLYVPREGIDERARNAVEYARAVASSPPTWNVHPVTRTPALLAERGNLNKNLSNLLLHCYTREILLEMVEARLLYSMPITQPGHYNWLTWDPRIGIAGQNPIFVEKS